MPISPSKFFQTIAYDPQYKAVRDGLEYIYVSANIYSFLMDRIRIDKGFIPITRLLYEFHFGIQNADVDDAWKDAYFGYINHYLETASNDTPKPTFDDLLDNDSFAIYNNCVQASFVSYLVHTLNQKAPIYNPYVLYALGIGKLQENDETQQIDAAKNAYRQLDSFYTNSYFLNLRKQIVITFDELCVREYGKQNDIAYSISETKKIDFILSLLGENKIRID